MFLCGTLPFELVAMMDDNMRAALCIIKSELNGAVFDWNRMQFKD